jgi:hypothetical protein
MTMPGGRVPTMVHHAQATAGRLSSDDKGNVDKLNYSEIVNLLSDCVAIVVKFAPHAGTDDEFTSEVSGRDIS